MNKTWDYTWHEQPAEWAGVVGVRPPGELTTCHELSGSAGGDIPGWLVKAALMLLRLGSRQFTMLDWIEFEICGNFKGGDRSNYKTWLCPVNMTSLPRTRRRLNSLNHLLIGCSCRGRGDDEIQISGSEGKDSQDVNLWPKIHDGCPSYDQSIFFPIW